MGTHKVIAHDNEVVFTSIPSVIQTKEAWNKDVPWKGQDEPAQKDNDSAKASGSGVAQDVSHKHTTTKLSLVLNEDKMCIMSGRTIADFYFPPFLKQYAKKTMWHPRLIIIWILLWVFVSVVSIMYIGDVLIVDTWVLVFSSLVLNIKVSLLQLSLINVDILKYIVKSFNFWYLMYHTMFFVVCIGNIWDWCLEIHMVVLHTFFSVTTFVVMDGFPRKFRRLHLICAIIGCLVMISILFSLYFSTNTSRQSEGLFVNDSVVFSYRIEATSSLFVIIIYCLRVIYIRHYYRFSNGMIFLTSFYEIKRVKITPPSTIEMFTPPQDSKKVKESQGDFNKEDISSRALESKDESVPENKAENHNTIRISNPNTTGQSVSRDIWMGILNMDEIEIDIHNTLSHRYLKKRYPTTYRILKSPVYTTIGIVYCLLVGFLMSPVGMGFEFSSSFSSITSFLCIPSIIFMMLQLLLTSNITIMTRTIQTFDFWYVIFQSVQIWASYYLFSQGDFRTMGSAYFALSCVWLMCLDTYPQQKRYLAWSSLFVAAISITCGIYCRFALSSLYKRHMEMLFLGRILVDPRIFLSSSLFSVGLFYLRFMGSYIKNPNRVLFVTQNWTTAAFETNDQQNRHSS